MRISTFRYDFNTVTKYFNKLKIIIKENIIWKHVFKQFIYKIGLNKETKI